MNTRRVLVAAFVVLSVVAVLDMAFFFDIETEYDDAGFRWELRWETPEDTTPEEWLKESSQTLPEETRKQAPQTARQEAPGETAR